MDTYYTASIGIRVNEEMAVELIFDTGSGIGTLKTTITDSEGGPTMVYTQAIDLYHNDDDGE